MRLIKMFGLAAIAVGAFMAFLGTYSPRQSCCFVELSEIAGYS
jgi:hypothetical protein